MTGLIDNRDKLHQDLRQVHDLRRRAQDAPGDPAPAQARRVPRQAADPRGALRGRGRHHVRQRGHQPPSFVTATDRTVKKLVQQFLGVEDSEGAAGTLEPSRRQGRKRRKRPRRQRPGEGPGAGQGPGGAGRSRRPRRARQLPVYYPTLRLKALRVRRPAALLQDPHAGEQVPQEPTGWSSSATQLGEYYGVQGTTWKDPPILESGSDKMQDGRAHVRAALRRRPGAAGGLAHVEGGLLDLQHPAPDA